MDSHQRETWLSEQRKCFVPMAFVGCYVGKWVLKKCVKPTHVTKHEDCFSKIVHGAGNLETLNMITTSVMRHRSHFARCLLRNTIVCLQPLFFFFSFSITWCFSLHNCVNMHMLTTTTCFTFTSYWVQGLGALLMFLPKTSEDHEKLLNQLLGGKHR